MPFAEEQELEVVVEAGPSGPLPDQQLNPFWKEFELAKPDLTDEAKSRIIVGYFERYFERYMACGSEKTSTNKGSLSVVGAK